MQRATRSIMATVRSDRSGIGLFLSAVLFAILAVAVIVNSPATAQGTPPPTEDANPTAAPNAATAADATAAPDAPLTVTAGVHIDPPFVMRTEDGFGGMAIDLWNALAEERGIETELVEFGTIRELVTAVREGEVDAALTALTITEARAEFIDFTHPWFDGGLQIMISDAPRTSLESIVGGLADSGHLQAFAWLGAIMLGATILLTMFDRRFDPEFPTRWRDGIANSFYTVMSVAVSRRPPSRKNLFGWLGRILSAFWLIFGLAVVAYVTSSITSVMTTLSLSNQINSLSDLPGKTVGVTDGSTAEDFVTAEGLSRISFPSLEEAIQGLVEGEVDAIVGDTAGRNYFAHTRPQHDVSVVGEIFSPEKYGFGIAQESRWRRPLTVELIGAEEAGLIEELRTKYFGAR